MPRIKYANGIEIVYPNIERVHLSCVKNICSDYAHVCTTCVMKVIEIVYTNMRCKPGTVFGGKL